MLTTLFRTPPVLNPNLRQRHERAARMIRTRVRIAGGAAPDA